MTTKTKILLSPPKLYGKENYYIQEALNSNWIVPLGPNVDNFEAQLQQKFPQCKYPLAMSSGTAAIQIALRLLGISRNDSVICQSLTFIASANPILYEGATPIFIDSEWDSWNMCPKSLESFLAKTKQQQKKMPKAIIVVDLFGVSANYDEILSIAKQYKIPVIEDAAEALGSMYKNIPCGAFGEFGIFSFNGNKIITTSGGGMLITHSQSSYTTALKWITQSREKAPYYLHRELGFNYRMSNVCAGIGIGQLEFLDHKITKRRDTFTKYTKYLSDISYVSDTNKRYSNRWLSTFIFNNKNPQAVIEQLSKHRIEARRIWKPLHTQPLFKDAQFHSINKKSIAELIFEKGICLPSGEDLTDQNIEQICSIIESCN